MKKEQVIELFKDLKEIGGVTKLSEDYGFTIESIKADYLMFHELKNFIKDWFNWNEVWMDTRVTRLKQKDIVLPTLKVNILLEVY
jgi:hypothetical protein